MPLLTSDPSKAEPDPKPHAAADGPLPAVQLSKEGQASAATKSDADIASALGTVSGADGQNKTLASKEKGQPQDEEKARLDDLEKRFAALKKR